MKKNIIYKSFICIILLIFFCANPVFAELGNGFDNSLVERTSIPTGITILANTVWGSVLLVFQMLAIAGVIITGVIYMFKSADMKAEIKKNLLTLIIGCVLVFATSTIVSFIVTATSEVM